MRRSTRCFATIASARPGARCSWKSSWRARSSHSSRSPTARRCFQWWLRRTISGCWRATVARTRAEWAPTHRCRWEARHWWRMRWNGCYPDAGGAARVGLPVQRAALCGAHAYRAGPQGGRVQLPLRGSGNGGNSAIAGEQSPRAVDGRRKWERAIETVTRVDRRARSNHRSCRRRLSRRSRKGMVIDLPPAEPNVHVFHAGTATNAYGELVTAGGRVFAVTAVAPTLADAQRLERPSGRCHRVRGKAATPGHRWRELERGAGASRN